MDDLVSSCLRTLRGHGCHWSRHRVYVNVLLGHAFFLGLWLLFNIANVRMFLVRFICLVSPVSTSLHSGHRAGVTGSNYGFLTTCVVAAAFVLRVMVQKKGSNSAISTTKGNNPDIFTAKGNKPDRSTAKGNNPDISTAKGNNPDTSAAKGSNSAISTASFPVWQTAADNEAACVTPAILQSNGSDMINQSHCLGQPNNTEETTSSCPNDVTDLTSKHQDASHGDNDDITSSNTTLRIEATSQLDNLNDATGVCEGDATPEITATNCVNTSSESTTEMAITKVAETSSGGRLHTEICDIQDQRLDPGTRDTEKNIEGSRKASSCVNCYVQTDVEEKSEPPSPTTISDACTMTDQIEPPPPVITRHGATMTDHPACRDVASSAIFRLHRTSGTVTSGPFMKRVRRARRLLREAKVKATRDRVVTVTPWRARLERYRDKIGQLTAAIATKDQLIGVTTTARKLQMKEIKAISAMVKTSKETLENQQKLNLTLAAGIEERTGMSPLDAYTANIHTE